MALSDMPDAEFYAHRREVDAEADRRERLAQIPEQLCALVRSAINAGIPEDAVRATVDGELAEGS